MVRSGEAIPLVRVKVSHGEFTFHLDEPTLLAISRARSRGSVLQIPKPLLADLRRLALLDDAGRPQSGLTFCSHYVDPLKRWQENILPRYGLILLRSVVALDGDIICQVHQDCLRHPYGREISAAHHWLTSQLLGQLQTNTEQFTSMIFSTLAVVLNLPTLLCLTQADRLFQDPQALLPIVGSLGMTGISCFLPAVRQKLPEMLWRSLINPGSPLGRAAKWAVGRVM